MAIARNPAIPIAISPSPVSGPIQIANICAGSAQKHKWAIREARLFTRSANSPPATVPKASAAKYTESAIAPKASEPPEWATIIGSMVRNARWTNATVALIPKIKPNGPARYFSTSPRLGGAPA